MDRSLPPLAFLPKKREKCQDLGIYGICTCSVLRFGNHSNKHLLKKGISRFGDKLLGTEEIFFDKSRLNLHIHAFKFDQISIIEVKVIAVQP